MVRWPSHAEWLLPLAPNTLAGVYSNLSEGPLEARARCDCRLGPHSESHGELQGRSTEAGSLGSTGQPILCSPSCSASASHQLRLLLDVLFGSTDDLNLFSPVLDGLRDRPPPPSQGLDQHRPLPERLLPRLCES
jgi:hypothetical protein